MAWIATIEVPTDDAERITDLLWREGTEGVAELPVNDRPHRVRLLAGFDEEDEARIALEHLGLDGSVAPVETSAWSNADRRTVVVGSHELTIESGQAFGHGEHPTTRLCLDLLAQHMPVGHSITTVLDVGTGTGVLAIAAAKLGAERVVGIDIDQAAIDVTRDNAAANDVVIEASTLSMANLALSSLRAFDLVVVNMLVAELEPIAADVVAVANGPIVVSGCLAEQADRIAAAFAPLEERERRLDGDWSGLVLA